MMIALSQARFQEIVGRHDNPEILKYFDDLGYDGSKLKDETSWCSAFVNWVCKEAGLEYNNKLNARSHLDYGNTVINPELGDKVIFWRESKDSWKGHVGFYIREDSKYIFVLGGNQSNQVKVSAYLKSRVLGYRRMTGKVYST